MEVLVVSDVFHPVDDLAVDDRLDRNVGHGLALSGTVPVLDARWCPDHIAGPDVLFLATPFLHPAASRDDDQGSVRPDGCARRCVRTG